MRDRVGDIVTGAFFLVIMMVWSFWEDVGNVKLLKRCLSMLLTHTETLGILVIDF